MIARLSLASRLALLFAACTASVSLLAGVLFSRASEAHFVDLDRQLMDARLEHFRTLLQGVDTQAALETRREELELELIHQPDLGLRLHGPDGKLWFAYPARLSREDLMLPAPGRFHDWQLEDSLYRVLHAPLLPRFTLGPKLTLLLDITHHQHFLEGVQRAIWATMALAALATALLGGWAARRGLRPLREMSEIAAGVSAQSLTVRLDEQSVPVELRGLVQALNAMLARLEEAFKRLSAFSADIAHELRTPLTALLTRTQVVLSQPRSQDEYREALHDNLDALEQLTQMVNDMLLLAKAEHGLLAPHREPLSLSEEIGGLLEFYEPVAEEAEVRFALEGDGTLYADRSLLRRMLGNLLENALRHTPPGGQILIQILAHAGGLQLVVENPGTEIPGELLPRLFDRFARGAPTGATNGSEHAGLGLAITRSLMEAHGGRIQCESSDGLTRFILEFPA
ncbi:heavy metal sensor histidine kinase [Pseudomonas indica]|uniref:Sensor protein n=1 Tax=Pseudomonas indica TaxID=137658 RepID=A0A1G9ENJ3_9PSED|nr:heavy metal sensor histidine kinase [Pseudomonas indica]MBU3056240.1 heavy metal sensor histidine kinase [Pseudomonas indica]PAU51833.1 two-component sensor histidine kinase [Pseudomonas indica]SDK77684.1 two-component system, OmpR family, heavy metal sensor histidine kinase CusS [Pseudomonas indica]